MIQKAPLYSFFTFLTALVCTVLLSIPAYAQVSSPDTENLVQMRYLGGASIDENNQTTVGLEVSFKDNWKTYWRIPGDAGLPPQFKWTGSENIDGTPKIDWPAPKRFESFGLENIGYGHTHIFPINVTVKEPAQPVTLQTDISLLVCDEICVPFKQSLSYNIPFIENSGTAMLEDALQTMPALRDDIHIRDLAVAASEDNKDHYLAFILDWPNDLKSKTINDIFIYTDANLFFSAPESKIETLKNGTLLKIKIPLLSDLRKKEKLADILKNDPEFQITIDIEGAQDILLDITHPKHISTIDIATINDAYFASVVQQTVSNNTDTNTDVKAPNTFYIILIAFVGGLILNVMPCVLPVLSLKLLSLIKSSDKSRQHIRKGFLASALGIITAFWGMAAILSALKAGGHAIGWGMQFQSSPFLIFMCAILLLFALNLWDIFHISLPQKLEQKLPTGQNDNFLGNFSLGIFATLLATPCSAPFLGTAVGFGLSQGGMQIFMIFSFLGLGLATPYLLVAGFPQTAQYMPKPGAWMIVIRRILGTALFVTAIWLGSIVAMNVIGRVDTAQSTQSSLWKPFRPQDIPTLVAQGKTVFVDITAEWCLTCKANKKFVLITPEIMPLLKRDNVVLMQGDWTQMDKNIADYINEFGRYGIPLNVIYGPSQPQGILLPELLSEQAIKDAFSKVK